MSLGPRSLLTNGKRPFQFSSNQSRGSQQSSVNTNWTLFMQVPLNAGIYIYQNINFGKSFATIQNEWLHKHVIENAWGRQ